MLRRHGIRITAVMWCTQAWGLIQVQLETVWLAMSGRVSKITSRGHPNSQSLTSSPDSHGYGLYETGWQLPRFDGG